MERFLSSETKDENAQTNRVRSAVYVGDDQDFVAVCLYLAAVIRCELGICMRDECRERIQHFHSCSRFSTVRSSSSSTFDRLLYYRYVGQLRLPLSHSQSVRTCLKKR